MELKDVKTTAFILFQGKKAKLEHLRREQESMKSNRFEKKKN